jgi:hypothetical protein
LIVVVVAVPLQESISLPAGPLHPIELPEIFPVQPSKGDE